MRQIEVGNFRRINRAKARRMYDDGKEVTLCACKMSPAATAWSLAATITKPIGDDAIDITFDARVNSYEYYNCNRETGRQTFFYERA